MTALALNPETIAAHARAQAEPLAAILMGCGVVGGGVLDLLPDGVRIDAILARTPRPAGLSGIPVFTDANAAFALNPDLVIDALPGDGHAETLVARAVDEGRHVVTANKRTAARRPDLVRAARAKGRRFECSAAVGGGAPVLETAAELARDGVGVTRVRGVLNGTSNFVLDRLAQGEDLADAVAKAQAAGFAEADPSADLDGVDAAHKLVLIARTLWRVELSPDAIKTESIQELPQHAAAAAARSGDVLRQVARLSRSANGVVGSVRLEAVPGGDPLARARDENNCVLFTAENGAVTAVSGKGAGRIPTASSLIGDLKRVCRDQPA